ncbi:MAG TPA: sigma-70 family RNA polymerase sigma factor [Bryobacteraceae bacterium]|nr:sigma-70 family RNA polymerase sigma factor [Bryobacteraceae bacterium]
MNSETEPVLELASQGDASLVALVDRVHRGDPSGMEELYQLFSKGIRFYLCRHLGPQDLDDRVHDLFLIIIQSIQRGDLREPERLMGYVRTVVRRQVAAHIDNVMQARRNQIGLDYGLPLSDGYQSNPERQVIAEQNNALAMRMLNSLHKREREVLMRFYLKEQTAEQICTEMDLTTTQFRLIKSRAKARFGELGKRRLSLKPGVCQES